MPDPPPRRRAAPLRGLALLLALSIALDQLVLHAFLADGELRGRRVAPFDPPLFGAGQREALARHRARAAGDDVPEERPDLVFDGELGWTVPPLGGSGLFRYDARALRIGARTFPAASGPGVRRVVAVGGSFTRGDEVEGHESWVARVDADPGFDVANLGVGGYGVDQAVLRYEREGAALEPDEVWLGLLPAALPRLGNVYRPLLQHWEPSVYFKPRFTLDDGGALVLRASPAPTLEHLLALLDDQRAFVAACEHDVFRARVPAAYAPRWSSPWHHSGLGRLWTTWRDHDRDPVALASDPTLGLAEVAAALCARLAAAAARDGARLRVFVLPSRSDLAHLAEHGTPYWSAVAERAGVEWHDLSAALLEDGFLARDDVWRRGGHWSPEGNRRVAELVLARVGR